MLQQLLLLALVVTTGFPMPSAVATRPPDVVSGGAGRSGVASTTVTVAEGRAAKLPCPVQPALFLEFFYGGELIAVGTQVGLPNRNDAEMTVRVDGANSHLRIASVRREQAGVYTCRVVNGFGTASVNVTLIVTDPSGIPFTDSPGRSTASAGASTPYLYNFVEPYPSNKTVSAGEQVTLECHVRGPANIPGVMWYKEQGDSPEDDSFVDPSTLLPNEFGSEYNVANPWLLVRHSFYSNTDMIAGQFTGRLTIPVASSRHAGRYLCSVSASRLPLYRIVTVSLQREIAPVDDYSSDGGDRSPSGGGTWLTTVFGSYSATLAVVIAVPSVVLLLAAAAVIYAVNKRKREHRAVKAKLRHQSKLGGSTADAGARQPPPAWSGAGGSGGGGNCSVDRGSGSSTTPLVAQQQQQQNSTQPVPSAYSGGVTAPLLGAAALPRADGLCAAAAGGGQMLYYPAELQYPLGTASAAASAATAPYQQLQFQLQHLQQQQQQQRRIADADDGSSDTPPSSSRHASSRGSDYPPPQTDAMYRYYGSS